MRQNAAGPATAATNEAVWQYLPAVGTPEWAVNPSWTDYSADDCAQWEACWVAQQAGDERRVFSTNELVGGYVGSSGHSNVTTNAPYEWFDKNMFTGVHRAVRRSSSSRRSTQRHRGERPAPPIPTSSMISRSGGVSWENDGASQTTGLNWVRRPSSSSQPSSSSRAYHILPCEFMC